MSVDAFAWMADQVMGTGPVVAPPAVPVPCLTDPVDDAAPTKRLLMIAAIEKAGDEGCTGAELGHAAGCEARQAWSILNRDVQLGLLRVRRTRGGLLRWIRGETPTREVGRAILLLQRHGYKVTR